MFSRLPRATIIYQNQPNHKSLRSRKIRNLLSQVAGEEETGTKSAPVSLMPIDFLYFSSMSIKELAYIGLIDRYMGLN